MAGIGKKMRRSGAGGDGEKRFWMVDFGFWMKSWRKRGDSVGRRDFGLWIMD